MSARKAAEGCSEDLHCGVNVVADAENMTDLEKKHVPVISAPDTVEKGECFEVTVEVGKHLAHPNDYDHFIGFVELYADHTFLGRQDFAPVSTCPVAKFCVQLDHIHGELRAFEFCNIHGTWEGTRDLTVTG